MVPQTSSTNFNCELVKNADSWATDLLYHNLLVSKILRTSLVAQIVKNLPAMQETLGWIPGSEDSLEKGMANHSSTLVWTIPWT